MGPTASGKTALALRLAQALDAEIVSVDSALVYRRMDIGTAKPTRAERESVPHHLIDICEPHEVYSAARFRDDALACIETLLTSGRLPLLVGGTMLYYRALTEGLAPMPGADARLREALSARAQRDGWAALHGELARVDPRAAQRIHPHDPQRIQRALEVWHLSGRPISEWQQRAPTPPPWRTYKLIVAPAEREQLHQRIAARFDAMLEQGLVAEVARLRADPRLGPELPSMRAVGYRQVWRYLAGEWSFEAMRERAVVSSRQLAKRQLTWLRRVRDAEWIDADYPPVQGLIERLRGSAAG